MQRRNWVLLGVALVLFVGAGGVWYATREPPLIRPDFSLPRPPVNLDTDPQFARGNILLREMMRQALFVAEREECGLPTRDQTLGESPAQAKGPARGLAAHAFVRAFDGTQVQVFRDASEPESEPSPGLGRVPATDKRRHVFQKLIPNYNHDKIDYPGLVELAEAFSRKEFKDAVGAGATASQRTGQPQPVSDQLLADLERDLGQMNFISQYAAVRRAHGAIRESGPSPQLLGALVRGYANLGPLTSHHYSAASKAFTARSLIYAQRMATAAGAPSPTGGAGAGQADAAGPSKANAGGPTAAAVLRHRAYAFALAGLQGSALVDLDRADQADPASAAKPPGWVGVLRPFCRYQSTPLAEIAAAGEADAPLALFLCFLTVEHCKSDSVTNGYGQIVLSAAPDCLRVLDAMMAESGVSANHVLTQAAPAVLAQSMNQRLPQVPGLPQPVQAALDRAAKAQFEPESGAAVAAALISAGAADEGEPSWTVLGRLIEEAQFAAVQRRARFMAEAWSVDASGFTREALPLYRNHRFRGLIDCYARGGRRLGPEQLAGLLKEAAEQLSKEQPTYSMGPLMEKLWAAEIPAPNQRPSFHNWQGEFVDFTGVDLERYLTDRLLQESQYQKYLNDSLHRASPHSPIYVAKRIQMTWNESKDEVERWKKDLGDHPMVSGALGRKYTELKQWSEAEKYLKAYLAKAPDQWAYEMLASNYLAQGDEANWLATLKGRLAKPDYGLSHARTNQLIARHYMSQKKWETALPYAGEAAESYSEWGLDTLADCYEGMGRDDDASKVRAAIRERYGR